MTRRVFGQRQAFAKSHPNIRREGIRGRISEALYGSGSIWRALAIYVILGSALLAWGFFSIHLLNNFIGGTFAILCAGWVLFAAFRSRGYSAAPVVPRAAIQSVVATSPAPPAKRGYFTVHFREGNQDVKRLIILPGSLEEGGKEYEKALDIFEKAGVNVATEWKPEL